MSKNKLLILALLVVLITAFVTLFINTASINPVPKNELESAINQAIHLYSLRKQGSEDLSLGPCLSDALMPNWVVDLVHNPRQPADDLKENQCHSYLEGRAQHFVELDLKGNLVRAQ